MSDNIDIRDGNNIARILRATDTAGVHTPHHIIDASALPTGAAIEAKQPAIGVAGTAAADVLTIQGITGMTPIDVTLPSIPAGSATIGNVGIVGTVPVSGTFWQTTQPVSAAALPLPTGAATAAKQPAIGAAGTAASDVLTIQGISGMVALKVDGSAVTQPVSGTVSVSAPSTLFRGRVSSYRIPGRAGTAGQNLISLFNGAGSGVTVSISMATVGMYGTVGRALTVAPPLLRLWMITAAPTNGDVVPKIKIGGSSSSDANVVCRQDASSDGTGSTTTLTATKATGNFIETIVAPRLITGAGHEQHNSYEFLLPNSLVLSAGNGVLMFLDYGTATMNPTTDMWHCTLEWKED